MRTTARAAVVATALAGALLLAGGAAAECALSPEYRAMHGEIAEVDADTLTLAQRSGDRVAFRKAPGVAVTGGKSSWGALAQGDHAIVGWRISDSPATAYEVCVLPGS